jgi:Uri superfamily endonuclease
MKGIYVLVISMSKDVNLNIGALGNVHFEKGLYSYVGSAQNNLEKRVKRHLGKEKRVFWHIDYLLNDDVARILKVFYTPAKRIEECRISNKISQAGIPVEGFGSSDCKCKAHLFRIEDIDFLKEYMHEMILKP